MSFLTAKQTKFTGYLSLYILIVLGVLGVLNFLAQRHNKSWDATANKRFSLSDQTTKVVSGLAADVKITHFDRTSNMTDPRGNVRDLLDRYDNLSPKLSVDYVDPDKKQQIARAMGARSYGATFVEANGKREEARSVTEEEVTGAIVRALKGGARTVCWTAGSGEHDFDESGRSGYSNLKEYIERNNYKTTKVSLLEKAEISKDCTILLVGGPRRDFLEPAVNAIKAYVEGGGKALFMLDPPVKLARDETDENAALTKLLQDWGIALNTDLVLELSPVGRVFGLGPEMPLVANYESHAVVREMKETATAFPLVRSLDTKSADKWTTSKLFSTSSSSVTTGNLSSPEIKIAGNEKKGPFALAAAGEYNNDKVKARIVVVGSSGFVSNTFLRFGGNRDLVMNMLNWLSQDEDLISIRPKEPEDRRLTMSQRQINTYGLYLLLIPLFVIGAGIQVWWKRR
jgi:ABC-type uncharacterized transport system involved in gliding motility auxiliary subunit